ncbi:hypothetical protein CHARACLAT_033360 [Characodon lateralis]|uniref:Uncharacterized protein n=1 Tax=Characodon lateralis TaxID=208331 RepID=A0ABU7EF88_9TELE|nr:hypothetical protein [Characodon lateralis]
MKCSKTSWQTAAYTLDVRKHSGPTPADDMAPQTITDCGNFTLDFILCLSSLPPDSGTLISKGNAKFTFIREHNIGPLSSSPVLFVFSHAGKMLLMLPLGLLFNSGLTQGMRQLKPMSCKHLCEVVLEALTTAAIHSL